ncbi:hypothetical protein AXF42_Ash000411 [Apostasia shenzhenica]|uniref:Zinc-finger domain-containing protein n=1 Tax=Apostasia shenzhenica TaxID=1088818 RepID=A0A2I0AGF7_9ASPA|nr:hypothetical protein AXF42_Ash000411 [Apostasia shenzhenica]
MVTTRRRALAAESSAGGDCGGGGGGEGMISCYEMSRSERIKENMERMKKLGILDLSLKLKSECRRSYSTRGRPVGSSRVVGSHLIEGPPTPPLAPRRSSRLQNIAPVNYSMTRKMEKKEAMDDDSSYLLREGQVEEIYTEEHEKLLGSCETSWTLFVDGYDHNGKRIYDPVKGKTCHQCRQKTLGHHTSCCKCKLVQGQFCGDCLYMRYGENVLDVEKNPSWVCPVCRGICNCSLCRIRKGWAPTGLLYKKIKGLGYKSVAHYLILTRRGQRNSADHESLEPRELDVNENCSNNSGSGDHQCVVRDNEEGKMPILIEA